MVVRRGRLAMIERELFDDVEVNRERGRRTLLLVECTVALEAAKRAAWDAEADAAVALDRLEFARDELLKWADLTEQVAKHRAEIE